MKSLEFWDKVEVAQHCYSVVDRISDYLVKNNKNNIKVLDIGANVGKIYDLLSEKFTIEKYVMYEASPILCEYMEKKFHGLSQVEIKNFAVSDSCKETFMDETSIKLALKEDKYEYTYNLGVQGVTTWENTPIIQLSAEAILNANYNFFENVDVIKIDTETVDYLILKSMSSFISKMKNKPLICFEHNYMFCNPEIIPEDAEKIYNYYINDLEYHGKNFNELTSDCFLYPKNSEIGLKNFVNTVKNFEKKTSL